MELGDKIIKFRKKEKFSQEALADKLGVTRQTISNWELNITKPDISQIKKISKIFNVSIDELLDNDIRDIIEKKVSNTEKINNKIAKNIKILGITLYFIILSFLIGVIIYYSANKDFTDIYRSDIICTLEDKVYELELTLNPDKTFIVTSYECDRNKTEYDGCYTEEFPAGNSVQEAMESLKMVKKVLISNGAICKNSID